MSPILWQSDDDPSPAGRTRTVIAWLLALGGAILVLGGLVGVW